MRCRHCNKEFSPKVWRIHVETCTHKNVVKPKELSYNDMRKLAKANDLNISNPSKDDLIKALRERGLID